MTPFGRNINRRSENGVFSRHTAVTALLDRLLHHAHDRLEGLILSGSGAVTSLYGDVTSRSLTYVSTTGYVQGIIISSHA